MTDNKALAKKIPLLEEFEEAKSENEDIVNDIINKYKELNEKCDVVLEKLKNKKIKPKAAASRTLAKSK
jgi:hypothetical protein